MATAAEFRAEVDIIMDDFFKYKKPREITVRPDISTGLTDHFAAVRLSEDGTKIETNDGLSCPVAEATAIYNQAISGRLDGYSTPSLSDPIFFGERVAAEIRVQLAQNDIIYSIGLAKLQAALGISDEAEEEEEEAAS